MGELEHGFGAGRILHFDCFSGLAGDMILASLVDLGVPLGVIESAIRALPLAGWGIRIERTERASIAAMRFVVDAGHADQPHRHYGDIRDMIEGADLDPGTKDLASRIFRALAQAEARVHGCEIDHVHFHEVGAVDSIVDIVGAAAALTFIGATVSCAPVPLGSGFVRTDHGMLPVPAPATLILLEGVPVEATEVEAELTTPTGAAIVRAAASSFGRFPSMIPERVGFGAGTRTFAGRPNLLRAVLGRPAAEKEGAETCAVLEANIDDMTGEIAAHAVERLFCEGALDAWIEPIQMKKGRPALKLSALVRRDDVGRLGALVLRETSTIGLRFHDVGRIEMTRTMRTVETPYGPIRVKVAEGPHGARNAAPEFEDCKAAAAKHDVPLKEVMAHATGLAQGLLAHSSD
ncbi:MAG: nickel pincer cofactor biosynthesis protein LarC [Deltaproteobacteria bacterium]|nr:nickel pincer cofactor biosynthesis protein LarC [Deltaproteobacteria bacterium]